MAEMSHHALAGTIDPSGCVRLGVALDSDHLRLRLVLADPKGRLFLRPLTDHEFGGMMAED
jgi:hypothetical protein